MSTNTVVRDLVVEMLSTHRYEFVPMYRYNGNKMSIHRYEFVPTCRYNGTKNVDTSVQICTRCIDKYLCLYIDNIFSFFTIYTILLLVLHIGSYLNIDRPLYRHVDITVRICRHNGTKLST